MRAIVVDDSRATRTILKQMFCDMGFTVSKAEDRAFRADRGTRPRRVGHVRHGWTSESVRNAFRTDSFLCHLGRARALPPRKNVVFRGPHPPRWLRYASPGFDFWTVLQFIDARLPILGRPPGVPTLKPHDLGFAARACDDGACAPASMCAGRNAMSTVWALDKRVDPA